MKCHNIIAVILQHIFYLIDRQCLLLLESYFKKADFLKVLTRKQISCQPYLIGVHDFNARTIVKYMDTHNYKALQSTFSL